MGMLGQRFGGKFRACDHGSKDDFHHNFRFKQKRIKVFFLPLPFFLSFFLSFRQSHLPSIQDRILERGFAYPYLWLPCHHRRTRSAWQCGRRVSTQCSRSATKLESSPSMCWCAWKQQPLWKIGQIGVRKATAKYAKGACRQGDTHEVTYRGHYAKSK